MTVANYSQAFDEMASQFNQAWQAGSNGIVGYIPEVRWPNVEVAAKPDGSKFFARFSLSPIEEPQTGVGACEDAFSHRYTPYGLIFIQIFCPKSLAQSMQLGRDLAHLAKIAYRGKSTPGGVWFRNVSIKELEDEALFHRLNVVAEYEYDEVG